MAQTKPTEALKNILAAERVRLRQRKNDPAFQRDLKKLESIAKRLAAAPLGRFRVSGLSKLSERDLEPTADEKEFHHLAVRFMEKWTFRPRWTLPSSRLSAAV